MIVTETPQPYAMTRPCKQCGGLAGTIRKSGPNNVVRCANPPCDGLMVYCAPKSETGEAVRTVRSRPDMDPSQRARILERDGWRCVACGRGRDVTILLHVAHMLSVADAETLRADGLAVRDEDLHSDANLYTACEECNLGQGARSLTLRIAYCILRANLAREGKRA